MFGFIKMIEAFFRKLRSNKRAWFSTIFLFSIIGIGLSTFLLIALTDNIAQEVYRSQAKEYRLKLRDFEQLKENELRRLAILFGANTTLIEAIKTNNTPLVNSTRDNIVKMLDEKKSNPIEVGFYGANTQGEILRKTISSSLQSKNDIFGIEVLHDGIFYVYLMPLISNGEVLGVIEVKESIYALKDSFERLGKLYLFALDGKMLSSISVQFREGVYEEISQDMFINKDIFNSDTMTRARTLNESKMRLFANGEYIVEKDMYLTGASIRDASGATIGMVVLGESAVKEGGFVSMSNKMSQQVVMVALGLIVSLLLFMF